MKWKPIKNYPNYEVSNTGLVRGALTKKPKKFSISTHGYYYVQLHNGKGKIFLVHRLVGEAFIGPLPKNLETCHIDGDRLNNGVKNLIYATHKENMQMARKQGRMGRDNPNMCKLSNEQVEMIMSRYEPGSKINGQRALAREFGVVHGTIYYALKAYR